LISKIICEINPGNNKVDQNDNMFYISEGAAMGRNHQQFLFTYKAKDPQLIDIHGRSWEEYDAMVVDVLPIHPGFNIENKDWRNLWKMFGAKTLVKSTQAWQIISGL
jgi:hypothetical protein